MSFREHMVSDYRPMTLLHCWKLPIESVPKQ